MPLGIVADEKNKWGLAPFHYDYKNIIDCLMRKFI